MEQHQRITRQNSRNNNAPVQHVQLGDNEHVIPQNPMIGFRRHHQQQHQNPIFLPVEEENLNGSIRSIIGNMSHSQMLDGVGEDNLMEVTPANNAEGNGSVNGSASIVQEAGNEITGWSPELGHYESFVQHNMGRQNQQAGNMQQSSSHSHQQFGVLGVRQNVQVEDHNSVYSSIHFGQEYFQPEEFQPRYTSTPIQVQVEHNHTGNSNLVRIEQPRQITDGRAQVPVQYNRVGNANVMRIEHRQSNAPRYQYNPAAVIPVPVQNAYYVNQPRAIVHQSSMAASQHHQQVPVQNQQVPPGYTVNRNIIHPRTGQFLPVIRQPQAPVDNQLVPMQYYGHNMQMNPPVVAQQNTLDGLSFLILDKIQDLKGTEGMDTIQFFFRKFDQYTMDWPDIKRVRALGTKLLGRAERAYNVACDLKNDYASIRNHILRQLGETDAKGVGSFDELMRGVTRKNGETIDDLGDRVLKLVKGAYSGLPPHLVDNYAMQHFIRSLGDEKLALSLEMERRNCNSFDHFVAVAAQMESTQRAIQFSINNKPQFRQPQQFRQQQPFRQPPFSQNNGPTAAEVPPRFNSSQNNQNRQQLTCFNCGKAGHMSRNCNEPRRDISQPIQNRNSPAISGANTTSLGDRKNYLKQNLLTVEHDEVVPSPVVRGIQIADVAEFFENLKSGKSNVTNENKSVGKIIVIKIEIFGKPAKAVIDPGAQISMVNAEFLYELAQEKNLDLMHDDFAYSGKSQKVRDVNGKDVGCLGVINLPIIRNGLAPANTRLHVTTAPFGYDFLIGTNALALLGFKLYDTPNKEFIDFECVTCQENFARVIFNTRLEPMSTKLVEISLMENVDGNILLSSDDADSVRIMPTLTEMKDRKAVVPVTNFSVLPINLEPNDIVGSAEQVRNFADANDLLSSNLVCCMKTEEINLEKESKRELIREHWINNVGTLTEKELSALDGVISEYVDIFATSDKELTQTSLVTHQIDTGDARPMKAKIRPVPYAYREKVASMVQDYLARSIIKPSHSPYASPIVLVPKRDGSLRFCVDYRGLNSVTVKDSFPLPNIDNTLLLLGNKKYFSTLDFLAGYWQIRMSEESVEKTAFVTEMGLYEFMVMPFGLTNAVATFQRFMSVLFEGILNDFVFVYIDDILVASNSLQEHLAHLEIVFERIRSAYLRLKINKCHFAAEEIPFLGHILTREGIKMDADKAKPVMDLPIPKTRKELHSFLGFMSYYRKFIYAFGEIASPLFRLLRDGTEFCVGENELEAISMLKEKIVKDVVLYFPDFKAAMESDTRQFMILTDASKIGISAVLCQPDEESRIRPIYFASRQCSKQESRYSPTELEALAVRFGAKKFAQFITMIPVRILTDHKALIPMFKSKGETGNSRVDKWIMELNARFILKLEYHPGKSNVVADLLSRSPALMGKNENDGSQNMPTTEDTAMIGRVLNVRVELEGELGWTDGTREEWIEKTKESELKSLYEFLETKILPLDTRESQRILSKCGNMALIHGLLYFCEQKSGNVKLFVPNEFRQKLLRERHEGICSGHQSGKKLYRQISEQYFWPNMRTDCTNYALNCRICAHTRKPRANQPGLQAVQTSEPLELVCLDILEIGKSNARNRYVLVIVDHFTKWTVAEALPDKAAESVARIFVEKFVLVFGSPLRLHSDKGGEFVNRILDGVTKILKIEKTTTLGYDPNANGMVERVNQIILGMLRRNLGSVWDWDARLQYCIFAINITPSESTGFSPFELMFGRKVNFPTHENVKMDVNPLYTIDEESYLQLFRENLVNVLNKAKENSDAARKKMVFWYNNKPNVTIEKFHVGDRVMVIFPGKNSRTEHKKLLWNQFGPYLIIEMSSSSAKCVPVDKKESEPIQVPLERMVKVPIGIPDIATLPKGKNPYKNSLQKIAALITLKENLEFGNLEKNKQRQSSGMIDFSGVPKEKKDELNWTNECAGELHSCCSPMIVADLDPIFDREDGIGKLNVANPLKALITIFLMKEGTAKSVTSAQQLVKTVVGADNGRELVMFTGKRGDNIESGKFPAPSDIKKAWDLWINHCSLAWHALAASGFGTIPLANLDAIKGLPEAERIGWEHALESCRWMVEVVRAKTIHRCEQLVEEPRVLIGDSSARQLLSILPGSGLICAEGTAGGENEKENNWEKPGKIKGIIRAMSNVVLSTKVQAVIIFMGRDSLLAGETVDDIVQQASRVLQMIKRFANLHIIWLPPPFVQQKSEEHEELIVKLRQLMVKSPVEFVTTTAKGRSIVELWRFGASYNQHNVSPTGNITENGLKFLRTWLHTQITGFPDNKSLGIQSANPPNNHSREQRQNREAERRQMHPSFGRDQQRRQASNVHHHRRSPRRSDSSRHGKH